MAVLFIFSHPNCLPSKARNRISAQNVCIRTTPSSSIAPQTRRNFLKFILTLPFLPTAAISRASCLAPNSLSNILPADFPDAWPYTTADFSRFDNTSDSIFYSSPRLVRHIDSGAQAALRAYYATFITSARDVLDICSSVESYLPTSWGGRRRVAGLGMNATELEANPALTESVVYDLNVDARLPYETASFDVVLCAMSVDYLTRPRQVLAEAARVLRPGGRIVLSFSNRVFGTKAVAVWMSGGDEDHIYVAASFLHFAGGFERPKVVDISPRKNGVCTGDPLYVVEAIRSS